MYDNVMIMEHPLIKHKISLLRNKNTGTGEFRSLVEEIAMLMAYESLRDLPLRAGLGMVNGITSLVPTAKVGHIGLCRNEDTHEPQQYYCKLPANLDQREVILLDPMLATGGSAAAAVDLIKQQGCLGIRFMCIIAAPEGLDVLAKAHPDIRIYCGNLDRCLNDNAYICPGLGDAGDRIFGTK